MVSSRASSELSTVGIREQAHPITSKSKKPIELKRRGRSTQGGDGRQGILGKPFLYTSPLSHHRIPCGSVVTPKLPPAVSPSAPLCHLHQSGPPVILQTNPLHASSSFGEFKDLLPPGQRGPFRLHGLHHLHKEPEGSSCWQLLSTSWL